ncbi:hypothetical protein QYE76_035949 [Lolium multiflorum]|uniref:Reverse transcriptase Ty1/copia-type domain-containing protein n=1 Tax=Lolium multiflorum TaxID=4521 RepID=A0AAD8VNY6_LOLMU|nr:hypothetical protein QYE76_035949 [Lolium multiflorum]
MTTTGSATLPATLPVTSSPDTTAQTAVTSAPPPALPQMVSSGPAAAPARTADSPAALLPGSLPATFDPAAIYTDATRVAASLGQGAGMGFSPMAGYPGFYPGYPGYPMMGFVPPPMAQHSTTPLLGLPAPSAAPPASPYGSTSTSPYGPAPTPTPAHAFPHGLPPVVTIALSITIKLTSENYLFWRAQVGPLLRSHLLMGYVDGTVPCPDPHIVVPHAGGMHHVPNPAHQHWTQQDQAILSGFVSSMTEGVLGMIMFSGTSREAWETLGGAFASTSIARSSAIRQEMAELKKGTKTINAYFHQMKALSDSLTSIGEPLRDAEFVSYILAGLDEEYDALYEVVTNRTTPIPIRDLFSQLQSTEHRKLAQRRSGNSSHYPAAHMAAPIAAYGAGRGGPRPPMPSFSSGKSPQPSTTPKTTGGRAPIVCQLCGVPRHTASRCYKRFNRDFLGIGNDGTNTEKQLAMAMSASHGSQGASQSVDPAWYADSGATHHITHELDKLTTREAYHGTDQVHTANGAGVGRGHRLEVLIPQSPVFHVDRNAPLHGSAPGCVQPCSSSSPPGPVGFAQPAAESAEPAPARASGSGTRTDASRAVDGLRGDASSPPRAPARHCISSPPRAPAQQYISPVRTPVSASLHGEQQQPDSLHGEQQQLHGQHDSLHEEQQQHDSPAPHDSMHAEQHQQDSPSCTHSEQTSATSSGAPAISAPTSADTAPVIATTSAPPPTGPVTRRRHGIHQPKQRTDGTVVWNCVIAAHTALKHTHEPRDYKEALRTPHWREAMETEFSALQANGTWKLVPPVSGVNLIDSRWVFKVKLHADGSIERYKACLVAKGYKQRYGLDYDETFSPVVKPATIRLLLAMALSRRWHLRQLDIQNVFLNGFLDEEVYMRQPPGFIDSEKPGHYCKLVRSLYGLKQAPRAWHARLSSVLGSLGFSPSVTDTSLFVLRRSDITVYLLVYVDDIIVLSSTAVAIPKLISQLRSEFSVKDLGILHYFLGIEVSSPSSGSLLLRQRKYALELLARAGMLKCTPVTTPMASSERLCSTDGDPLSPEEATQYRSIVGGLQYLTMTRPDLSFVVNKLTVDCSFGLPPLHCFQLFQMPTGLAV